MRLDDAQIERYARQIVLPEVGAEGQRRLLDARVVLAGADTAGTHLLGYLAAAGVGTIVAPPALHGAADPAHTDVRVSDALPPDEGEVDVTIMLGADAARGPRARHVLWIAGGRAGEEPPCAACVAAALPPVAAAGPALEPLRAMLLGTAVATEVLKRLLGVGAPLAGRVLAYDPARAEVAVETIAPRPDCAVCAPAAEG